MSDRAYSANLTRSGVMRDTIFSVEERGLGAVMIWVTHSDSEGYCFTDEPHRPIWPAV
ncbi:MAG: hypothetical protein R3E79_16325 [Caldilineaceae bacterium]